MMQTPSEAYSLVAQGMRNSPMADHVLAAIRVYPCITQRSGTNPFRLYSVIVRRMSQHTGSHMVVADGTRGCLRPCPCLRKARGRTFTCPCDRQQRRAIFRPRNSLPGNAEIGNLPTGHGLSAASKLHCRRHSPNSLCVIIRLHVHCLFKYKDVRRFSEPARPV